MVGRLGIERPLLVASPRFADAVELPTVGHWSRVPTDHVPLPEGTDSVIAVGGGATIDTAKAVSAASGLPLVSIPTTYSGAEWAPSFGIRSPQRRLLGGGSGALLAAIVYDVELTLRLPRAETVGTALNALAHCAEALYTAGRNDRSDRRALEGAALIARFLPLVVDAPSDLAARTGLLHGAAAAGEALGLAGLALAHAIAQAVGGSYGLPHGAMNALSLPVALRFNAALAPEALARFGEAIGDRTDPAGRVEALAALGGFGRLRDYGVPATDLPRLAAIAAGRAGNRANPRPATSAEIAALLEAMY